MLMSNMKIRAKILSIVGFLVMLLLLNIVVVYYYQSLQKADTGIVNIAGRQRMLSQKIAFAASAVATGDKQSRAVLSTAVKLYDQSLTTLKLGGVEGETDIPPAPVEVLAAWEACNEVWGGLKKNVALFLRTPYKDAEFAKSLVFIGENNDRLLTLSHAVVTAYNGLENAANFSNEINIAGRQRMLSQKIAKLVFCLVEDRSVGLKQKLSQAIMLFDRSLQALKNGGSITGLALQKAPLAVRDKLENVEQLWHTFKVKEESLLRLSPINEVANQALAAIQRTAPKLLAASHQLTVGFARVGTDKIDFLLTILIIFFIVSIIVAIFGYFVANGISIPVNKAVDLATEIAQGNLAGKNLKRMSNDEVGHLVDCLNDMRARLARIVQDLKSSAESVSIGANTIAASSEEGSRRAQEQAASLEETASAIEQMNANIQLNAENAVKANSMAQETVNIATIGESVVAETVTSMQEVTKASDKIANIIEVVNDISFQTNLLALNAAVEAARAGEQGRGFAVVAGEVRVLASRSADAAKEIKVLIDDARQKVSNGNQSVEETGNKLGDIITGIKELAETIAAISAASREQAAGIQEINKAVSQMDQAVQSGASMSEEAEGTAMKLTDDAQLLQSVVATFRTSSNAGKSLTAGFSQTGSKNFGSAPVMETISMKPVASTSQNSRSSVASNKSVNLDGFEEF